MKIAIRMDDITPDMDWAKFDRFKALLDKYDVKPLIGVVPDNKDEKLSIDPKREDFWQYVKELQEKGWIVAMHGLNHLYTTKKAGLFPIGGKSEFAGLPLMKQDEMIRQGKGILEENGIFTDIFMAPSHSFDKHTLTALKNNGFCVITDGFGITPFKCHGMTFYPIAVKRSDSISDTRDGLVTFVYHANTMDDKDFQKLGELLDMGIVVSYSEFSKGYVEERGFVGEARQYILAKAKYTAMQVRKLRG